MRHYLPLFLRLKATSVAFFHFILSYQVVVVVVVVLGLNRLHLHHFGIIVFNVVKRRKIKRFGTTKFWALTEK